MNRRMPIAGWHAFLTLAFLLTAFAPTHAVGVDLSGATVEVAIGTLIHPYRHIESPLISPEHRIEPYHTVTLAGTVALQDWLSAGLWVGYLHNSPYLEAARDQGIVALSYPLTHGGKLVIGDFRTGIATSVNFGVTPSIGVYYQRFFINVFVGGITTVLINTYDAGGDLLSSTEETRVLPFIELGYSFAL